MHSVVKRARFCTDNRLHATGFISLGEGKEERWICQECGALATTRPLDPELEEAMNAVATTQRQEREAKIIKLLKLLDQAIFDNCFTYSEQYTTYCTCCHCEIYDHDKNCAAAEITALVHDLQED